MCFVIILNFEIVFWSLTVGNLTCLLTITDNFYADSVIDDFENKVHFTRRMILI